MRNNKKRTKMSESEIVQGSIGFEIVQNTIGFEIVQNTIGFEIVQNTIELEIVQCSEDEISEVGNGWDPDAPIPEEVRYAGLETQPDSWEYGD